MQNPIRSESLQSKSRATPRPPQTLTQEPSSLPVSPLSKPLACQTS